jgi:hypothetical protein
MKRQGGFGLNHSKIQPGSNMYAGIGVIKHCGQLTPDLLLPSNGFGILDPPTDTCSFSIG